MKSAEMVADQPDRRTQYSNNSQTAKDKSSLFRQVAPLCLIFVLACTVLMTQLGNFPLFNPDEGLYAEPAREILDTNEWLTSLLNYQVRYTKPPLTIWTMAVSYMLFGVNEFAARFPGACCGAFLILFTALVARRHYSQRVAIFSGLILLTSPLYVATGRMAITDIYLSLFQASAIFAFYQSFRSRSKTLVYLGYVLVGLAVMTKGPVGVLLPALIMAAYHALKGNLKEAVAHYRVWSGALIVGLIALPWFITEIIVTKGEYFYAFIVRENFQRFTSVVDSHKGQWWYHTAAVFGGMLPWSVFLPQVFGFEISRCAKYFALPDMSLNVGIETNRRQTFGTTIRLFVEAILDKFAVLRQLPLSCDFSFFCLLTSLTIIVFYSASVSKLLAYTLPAFPFLAILIACEFERIIEEGKFLRLLVPTSLLLAVFGVAGFLAPILLGKLRDAPSQLFPMVSAYISFQTFAMSILVFGALARKYKFVLIALCAFTLLASPYFGLKACQLVSDNWEKPIADYARFAAGAKDIPLVVFDLRKPGVPFYFHKPVLQPHDDSQIRQLFTEYGQLYIITKSKKLDYFKQFQGCKVISSQGKFMLVSYIKPKST